LSDAALNPIQFARKPYDFYVLSADPGISLKGHRRKYPKLRISGKSSGLFALAESAATRRGVAEIPCKSDQQSYLIPIIRRQPGINSGRSLPMNPS
jgi:hypothetical protein